MMTARRPIFSAMFELAGALAIPIFFDRYALRQKKRESAARAGIEVEN
jgi:hypothetical protein